MTLTWTGLTYSKLELRKQEFEDWVTKGFKIGVGPTGIPPKSTTTTVVTTSKVATQPPTTATEKSETTTVKSTTTTTKKATTTKKITTPIRSEEVVSNVQDVVASITDKPSEAPVIESTNAAFNNQEPIKYEQSDGWYQGSMV